MENPLEAKKKGWGSRLGDGASTARAHGEDLDFSWEVHGGLATTR